MKKTIGTTNGAIQVDMTPEEISSRLSEEGIGRLEISRNLTLNDILKLEKLQTPRRIREAALGRDAGYLSDLDNQIAQLRAQIV